MLSTLCTKIELPDTQIDMQDTTNKTVRHRNRTHESVGQTQKSDTRIDMSHTNRYVTHRSDTRIGMSDTQIGHTNRCQTHKSDTRIDMSDTQIGMSDTQIDTSRSQTNKSTLIRHTKSYARHTSQAGLYAFWAIGWARAHSVYSVTRTKAPLCIGYWRWHCITEAIGPIGIITIMS